MAIFAVSAKTGKGLDAWLDEVTTRTDAGRHIAEVDYDVYAEGEAVLGWLNATILLRGEPADWNVFAGKFLSGLSQRFDSMGASIGHVKLMVEAGDSFLIGNLTGKEETLSIRGQAGTGSEARLTLNARVQMPPETLETIVRETIDATTARAYHGHSGCLALSESGPAESNPSLRPCRCNENDMIPEIETPINLYIDVRPLSVLSVLTKRGYLCHD